jgi:hypothetical protein
MHLLTTLQEQTADILCGAVTTATNGDISGVLDSHYENNQLVVANQN